MHSAYGQPGRGGFFCVHAIIWSMEVPLKLREQISQLPKTPGVYFFKNAKGEVLYVGKATSLRDRVRSYWAKELNRGPSIQKMVTLIGKIDVEPFPSTMEAMIAEANYIKRYLPRYNIQFRDDKSYFYVKVDSSDGTGFARLSMVHKNEILQDEAHIRYFGPYTSGRNLRLALKTIRKIFPYRSCTVMPKKACLQYHIKRCQAPCIGEISRDEYRIAVRRVVMILEGKKESLIKQLKREMEVKAKRQHFEEAATVRNQYLALQSLHQMAKISDTDPELDKMRVKNLIDTNIPHRIEGYDVSNLSGREAAVSMVVFLGGKPAKHLYKRFKIKTVTGPNDYAMLQEAVSRRLAHAHVASDGAEEMVSTRTWDITDSEDWQLPDVMVIDGGRGQLTAVKSIMDQREVHIPIIGIAKGPTRKAEDLYFSERIQFNDPNIIRSVRDEAHRFAGAYHRTLRSKRLIRSELDDIAGVGPKTKQTLLTQFGSVKAVRDASYETLSQAVGAKTARAIRRSFGLDPN